MLSGIVEGYLEGMGEGCSFSDCACFAGERNRTRNGTNTFCCFFSDIACFFFSLLHCFLLIDV